MRLGVLLMVDKLIYANQPMWAELKAKHGEFVDDWIRKKEKELIEDPSLFEGQKKKSFLIEEIGESMIFHKSMEDGKDAEVAPLPKDEEFGKMLAEDFKKYGKTEEGQLSMDSGIQKQNVGKIKEEKKLKFILDEAQIPQRLDHAVGTIKMGKENYRYYGVLLDEEIEKDGKMGFMTFVKKVPALVLEDGRIISQTSKPEGVKFEFDSMMTLKKSRWSLKSIKEFHQKNYNKENYSFKEVFESLKKHYSNSMVYEDKMWYEFRALRDLKTYYWDLIDKFLIVKAEGKTGSAKSKGMKIGANLSFNGKKFLCPTPANFFRYRHNNKATIFIEEAERLFDHSKKQSVGDSELVEYLNGSYEKGNTVPRQNDKNISQTDEFDPSGETEIGSIKPLKGALEKRSIKNQMVKAIKSDSRGDVEIPTETDFLYQKTRDMAYICGLLNYKKYEEKLLNLKNKFGLANREWALAKPYLALANCIDPKLEKNIGEFLLKSFRNRDSSLDVDSWEIKLAKCLVEYYSMREGPQFLPTNELTSSFSEVITGDYKISSIKVGMMMNTLGFSDFRDSTGEIRGFKIDFWKVCELLIRQECLSLQSIKNIIQKKVSRLSGCKFTVESIDKWYTDTFLTPYTLKGKSSDTLTPLTAYRGSGIEKEEEKSKKKILNNENGELVKSE